MIRNIDFIWIFTGMVAIIVVGVGIMLNRDEIIQFVKEFSQNKSYVNAMWLEGADGVNKIDEYSDIDFWFDVDKKYQESFLYECIEELKKIGIIDSRVDEIRNEIAQSNIHLSNTSEYLTLDICVQSHEIRGYDVTCYVKNDIAELPLIIFDKSNIISFTEYQIDINEIKCVFENNKNRILQNSRVRKYIKRNQYLEAYTKYIDNIANPLVKIARLIYTPRHYDYVLCHISDHLPKEVVEELETLYRVTSLKEIENNLQKSLLLLEKYEKQLNEKYNINSNT